MPKFEEVTIEGLGTRAFSVPHQGVKPGVPPVKRFYFLFTGGSVDHRINTIMVQPDGEILDVNPYIDPSFASTNPDDGNERLAFQDDNGNHEFFFKTSHLLIPPLSPSGAAIPR